MTSPQSLLKVAEEAAAAGAEQLRSWRGRFKARNKAPSDLVTDADLASEQAIRAVIRAHFPDHGILGEEDPVATELERDFCWLVDPLDGTTNYVHGFPFYGVSVAVAKLGELLAGVVYDPERDECFAAAAGSGATLNGAPMRPATTSRLSDSLLAVSFPAQLTTSSPDLQAFLNTAPCCQAIRRTGSAALNLAYVACGRLDGHWAHEIHPWDAAAGVLLIREAGGVVTACGGTPFVLVKGNYLAAASMDLHAELRPLVNS